MDWKRSVSALVIGALSLAAEAVDYGIVSRIIESSSELT